MSTKLAKRKAGGIVIDTTEAVNGALVSLGLESVTFGCFKHDLVMSLISGLPELTVDKFLAFKLKQTESDN